MRRLPLLFVALAALTLLVGRWVRTGPEPVHRSEGRATAADCARYLFKAPGDTRGIPVVPPECAYLFFEGVEPPQARSRTPGAQPGFQAAGLFGPCSVLRVIDGDTIDVGCGGQRERVRLLRIDTPERGNPGYRAAGEALEELLGDGEVYLEFEQPGQPQRGRYGRLLAYVYAEGENVNVEMVREGWSQFWTKYGAGRYVDEFREAEDEARDDVRGLWAWEYE